MGIKKIAKQGTEYFLKSIQFLNSHWGILMALGGSASLYDGMKPEGNNHNLLYGALLIVGGGLYELKALKRRYTAFYETPELKNLEEEVKKIQKETNMIKEETIRIQKETLELNRQTIQKLTDTIETLKKQYGLELLVEQPEKEDLN